MTITDKVYSVLSSAAGVTALVPASRIKPHGRQQGLTPPYIVHSGMLASTIFTHDGGLAKLREWEYKVSSFAQSESAAKAVAAAVEVVLGNYRGAGMTSFYKGELEMPYEADVLIQQIVQTFTIWASL